MEMRKNIAVCTMCENAECRRQKTRALSSRNKRIRNLQMEGWKGEGDKEDRRGDEDVQASDMNEQKELKLEIA